MTWFKVDDNLAFHPKVLAAGNAAMGLWVRAGAWCAGFPERNGKVSSEFVKSLGASLRDANRLVDVGLWTKDGDDFLFHDWEEFQPSKAQIDAQKEATRKRVAKHRNARRNGVTRGVTHEGDTSLVHESNAVTNGVPVPVPIYTEESNDSSDVRAKRDVAAASAADSQDGRGLDRSQPDKDNPAPAAAATPRRGRARTYPAAFEAFWAAFPPERKTAKAKCHAAWKRAVADGADTETITQAAAAYAADPNRAAAFTASPLTWLNQERWDAGPLPPRDARPGTGSPPGWELLSRGQKAFATDLQRHLTAEERARAAAWKASRSASAPLTIDPRRATQNGIPL